MRTFVAAIVLVGYKASVELNASKSHRITPHRKAQLDAGVRLRKMQKTENAASQIILVWKFYKLQLDIDN